MRSLVITLGIAVAFHALDAQASPWHPVTGTYPDGDMAGATTRRARSPG